MKDVSFTINGNEVTMSVQEGETLLELLRERLNLLGTKCGCEEGDCGACTVILDGKSVTSCLVLASRIDGCEVQTIEGLGENGELDPVQQAFIEEGAIQCGFCTPGMVMSTKALLTQNNNPTREDIKKGLSGNLCRCTGYKKIINAVEKAANYQNNEK